MSTIVNSWWLLCRLQIKVTVTCVDMLRLFDLLRCSTNYASHPLMDSDSVSFTTNTCLTTLPQIRVAVLRIIWSGYTGPWMGGLLDLVQWGADWASPPHLCGANSSSSNPSSPYLSLCLPSLPLPFPLSSSLPFPSLSVSLPFTPKSSYGAWGSAVSSQRSLGRSLSQNLNLVHFKATEVSRV